MTSTEPTPAGAALVAIDVAKLRNEVLIELPEARRRRRLTVTNCRSEHDRFVAELQALARPVLRVCTRLNPLLRLGLGREPA